MSLDRMGYSRRLDTVDVDATVARVTDTLAAEGFGVLTEIDVEAVLAKKLGVAFGPYRILGACNPQLAHRGLTAAPALGLLLPCNVIVRRVDDAVEVSAIRPSVMFETLDDPDLGDLATDADARLRRAIDAL